MRKSVILVRVIALLCSLVILILMCFSVISISVGVSEKIETASNIAGSYDKYYNAETMGENLIFEKIFALHTAANGDESEVCFEQENAVYNDKGEFQYYIFEYRNKAVFSDIPVIGYVGTVWAKCGDFTSAYSNFKASRDSFDVEHFVDQQLGLSGSSKVSADKAVEIASKIRPSTTFKGYEQAKLSEDIQNYTGDKRHLIIDETFNTIDKVASAMRWSIFLMYTTAISATAIWIVFILCIVWLVKGLCKALNGREYRYPKWSVWGALGTPLLLCINFLLFSISTENMYRVLFRVSIRSTDLDFHSFFHSEIGFDFVLMTAVALIIYFVAKRIICRTVGEDN